MAVEGAGHVGDWPRGGWMTQRGLGGALLLSCSGNGNFMSQKEHLPHDRSPLSGSSYEIGETVWWGQGNTTLPLPSPSSSTLQSSGLIKGTMLPASS